MIFSLPARQLRKLSDAQRDLVRYDESEELNGYRMERAVILLTGDFMLSVIWGVAYHRNISDGVHCGYPDKLEGYIPGLGIDPVQMTPREVMAVARMRPDCDWLMQL